MDTDLFLQSWLTRGKPVPSSTSPGIFGQRWTLPWQFLDFSSSASVSCLRFLENSLEMVCFSPHSSTILDQGFPYQHPTDKYQSLWVGMEFQENLVLNFLYSSSNSCTMFCSCISSSRSPLPPQRKLCHCWIACLLENSS